MKIQLLLFCAAGILISCSSPDQLSSEENWIQLYNGKDLSGWTPKFTGSEVGKNYLETFQAADSLLRVSYVNYDTFKGEYGHLFYKDSFSHYRLRAKYKIEGEQARGGAGWAFANNGFMLHAQSPESMTLDQEFPLSVEFQFLGAEGDAERPTGNLCTPGCHVEIDGELYLPHCTSGYEGPSHSTNNWVSAEAIVLGDSVIHHIIELDTVFTYFKPVVGGYLKGLDTTAFKPGTMLEAGYVAIQAESHGIVFKNIELLDLCGCMDRNAKNYKSYYVKSKPASCVY